MKHQEIAFGVTGQQFYYDPPELYRPSGTPTVQVWLSSDDDTNPALTATTGSCSVDSVNTQLTNAYSRGDQTIVVDTGTGIERGRVYLLTGSNKVCERVEVMSVSDVTVQLRHPLVNDYDDESTFQGTRISCAVNATFVSTMANLTDVLSGSWRTDVEVDADRYAGQAGYRLRWVYTANSVDVVGYSFADLVRYQAKNLVTPGDVDNRFPGWIDRIGPDYHDDQGASLVAEAYNAVRMDALADAVLLRKVRNTEVLRDLVIYRANVLTAENQVIAGSGSTVALELAQRLYTQRYDQLVREPKFPTDSGGGGASGQSPRLPITRR